MTQSINSNGTLPSGNIPDEDTLLLDDMTADEQDDSIDAEDGFTEEVSSAAVL